LVAIGWPIGPLEPWPMISVAARWLSPRALLDILGIAYSGVRLPSRVARDLETIPVVMTIGRPSLKGG
jgi:hypothetical protein